MELKKCRVLVTGGAGFIGSWIAEYMCKDNRVSVLDDLSTGRPENLKHLKGKVDVHIGDIRNLDAVKRLTKDVDLVFHQAAQVQIPRSIEDPATDAEINANGTLNVLEACRRNDVKRLVFASSTAVYGEPVRLPVREDHPLNPKSPYALSKLTAESYVRLYSELYGLETVSLRYLNVYGERQSADSSYSGVISIFLRNLKQGKPLTVFGDGEQTRDFVNVRDVARANLLAALSKRAVGKAINIGTGKSVSLNELIKILGRISAKTPRVVHKAGRQGDVKHSCGDISLAKTLLGYSPTVSLEKGLAFMM